MNIVHSFGLKIGLVGISIFCGIFSVLSVGGCAPASGTYAFGSEMPGAECFATLLPEGGGGDVTVLLPGKDDPEAWTIDTPTQVLGGTQIGILPDSGVTIDGHLEPVTCPETMAEEGADICLEVLCPICRDPDGCPIQQRDD